ncbi:AraC family ligand binding domain-containing protein [Devosia algicola]|uniref:AraC family ligand binding domain-containing protein n=1 Tax=Devosia algicola TaxID=3026418 RepID=A0ABY7YQD3_9HYPH|nr:AraC family ligand binding domain-containing protein [Devosia algicola]WDR03466.1 AraC family ligand binding domain-containing protein [Devosia algicola]
MSNRSTVIYRKNPSGMSPLISVREYGTHRISTQIRNRALTSFGVVMVERGTGRLRVDGGHEQAITAPVIFWLWPGMIHSYGPDPGGEWDEQWALFEGHLADEILRTALITPRNYLLQALRFGGDAATVWSALRRNAG